MSEVNHPPSLSLYDLSIMFHPLQETNIEEELKEAFKVFDKDQNGFISAAEVNLKDTFLSSLMHAFL